MPKVLLAVTSYNEKFYPDGLKTGLYASEAIHPFEVFKAAGFDVDFASETGTFGYDEHSIQKEALDGDSEAIYNDKHSDYNISLKNIKKASEVNPDDYAIFFAAGGHGTVFDFPISTGLRDVAEKIWINGGVISAVCHGPAIFAAIRDTKTGKLLVEGKNITGFTNAGEKVFGLEQLMEEKNITSIEDLAIKVGANYTAPPEPLADFTVVDGRIVTGANPASAEATAKKAIAASRQ